MAGKKVVYFFDEKHSISKITIPVSLAESLNWENKDEISVLFEVKDGQKGLFLFKEQGGKNTSKR